MARNTEEYIKNKAKSKTHKYVRKKARRISGWTYFFCLVSLVLGVLAGVGACYLVYQNESLAPHDYSEYKEFQSYELGGEM